MRCTLFGATGFLGLHVAEALVARGHAVRACVRATTDTTVLDTLGVPWVRADFQRGDDLARAMDAPDAVLNCIADVRLHKPLETYRRTDVHVTRGVAEAAARAGARRFVQLSTVEVYGRPRAQPPFDESTPCAPEFPFQQASCEREQTLRDVARRKGLEATVLRPASAIGRGNRPLERLAQAHAHGRFPIIGSGTVPFAAVDARDVGRAMCWLAEHAGGETYLLKAFDTSWLELKEVMDAVRKTRSKVQRLPTPVAYALARVLEWATPYSREPMFTRFVVRLLTTPHLYDDAKLRATGFVPRFGLHDAIAYLIGRGERTGRYL